MKTFGAREAKENFGMLIDTVQREPVTILKNGRPSAVVVSPEDYARMGGSRQRILDLQKQMAEQAEASGLTVDLLASILDER